MSETLLLVLFAVFMIVIIYLFLQNNQNNIIYPIDQNYVSVNNKPSEKVTTQITTQQSQPVIPVDIVSRYDYKKMYDPLQDPRQRPDRYLLGPIPFNPLFNVPTQGYADTYRWMGVLIHTSKKDYDDNCAHGCDRRKNNYRHRDKDDKDGKDDPNEVLDMNNRIIKFFGRQKTPGSNQYQYYANISSGNDMIKIWINHQKELYDGDLVYINELNGRYRVQLNKNDDVAYNPYLLY